MLETRRLRLRRLRPADEPELIALDYPASRAAARRTCLDMATAARVD